MSIQIDNSYWFAKIQTGSAYSSALQNIQAESDLADAVPQKNNAMSGPAAELTILGKKSEDQPRDERTPELQMLSGQKTDKVNSEGQKVSENRADEEVIEGQKAFGQKTLEYDPLDKDANGIPDSQQECETCKNRKYQDGSDEMVSFKSPAHVSPQAAGSAVRSHEQEHVANAYKKASNGNGKVLQASVQIHIDICPECGRSYVSGGTTSTQIVYYNEDNPYQQDLKAQDATKYSGQIVDAVG